MHYTHCWYALCLKGLNSQRSNLLQDYTCLYLSQPHMMHLQCTALDDIQVDEKCACVPAGRVYMVRQVKWMSVFVNICGWVGLFTQVER